MPQDSPNKDLHREMDAYPEKYGHLDDSGNTPLKEANTPLEPLSLDRLQKWFSFSPDMVFGFQPNGEVIYLNEKAGQITGFHLDSDIRVTIQQLLPKFDDHRWAATKSDILNAEYYNFDEEMALKSGSRIKSSGYFIRLILDGHELYVLLGRDISQQKRAEEALLISEQMYHQMFNSAFDGIIVRDYTTGIALNANPRILAMLGYKEKAEIINLKIPDICTTHKYFTATDLAARYSRLKERDSQKFDWILRRKDGSEIWVEMALIQAKIAGHQRIIEIYRDITQRITIEKELQASNELYKLIVDHQTDLIVKTDADYRITFASPSYYRLLGIDENEIIHSDFRPFVHPEDMPSTKEAMASLVKPPHTAYHEQRVQTKDGWRWIGWKANAVLDDNQNIVEIVGLGRDITQRINAEEEKKRLQNKLQQAQKMESVGTLAGGIAHDFNNLLTVIFGHLEIIKMEHADNPALNRSLNAIKKASDRAANLTNQLLAFSRKQFFQPATIHINEAIHFFDKKLKSLCGDSIRLKINYGSNLPPIDADAQQIEQILSNIILNARDAIIEKGNIGEGLITLTTALHNPGEKQRERQRLSISIDDNGTGIEEHIIAKIFDPFFTTKEVDKGTGLGLAMVYGIVKQNNGEIAVQSTPGEGTHFEILWPLSKAVDYPPKEQTRGTADPVTGNRIILLVEDEETVRNFLKEALNGLGFGVLIAPDGEEAIELFRANRKNICLVISDVIMPKISGKEMGNRIREMKPDIKILFTSGYTDDYMEKMDAGISNEQFLAKPFSLEALRDKIQKMID
jgi:two-component system cell cycle sensor histidine kinase/response regulator CckA